MFILINMPHYSIERPCLPLSLFKALFEQQGLRSKVLDLNFLLAGRIGAVHYGFIENRVQYVELVNGLWGPYVWGSHFLSTTEEWLHRCKVVLKNEPDSGIDLSWLREFRDVHIPWFLSMSLERVLAGPAPSVIGFSCYVSQVLPALALGRLIRDKRPEIKLVYGGAAFHGDMGDEYIRKIDWIDAVSTGEADDVVVRLFRDLGESKVPRGLQGILYRDLSGAIKHGPTYRPVSSEVFAALPDPDYGDFFESAVRYGMSADPQWRKNVLIPFEGSRGCWWGSKSQCAFCGLNGCSMVYRKKTGARIYKTLCAYVERYRFSRFLATDTIMSREHFDTLLPRLANSPFRKQLSLCGEIRADISRDQARALAGAGFDHLQCGIENLSTRILRLLRKGMRGLQNVYFLKLCRQYGISPVWYFLHRVPGEDSAAYRESAELIPKIVHLHPPRFGFAYPVLLYRFSPYFKEKKRIRNVRPKRWYGYQYAADRIDLSRVAYAFDADWLGTLDPKEYDAVNACISAWHRVWTNDDQIPQLSVVSRQSNGEAEVEDTRSAGTPRRWLLAPEPAAVMNILDDPASPESIMRRLARHTIGSLSCAEVDRLLQDLIEKQLIIREGNTYLSLVLPFQGPDAA